MPKDDPMAQEIVRLYSEGKSAAQVAKIVCFSETGVIFRLKSAGYPIRSSQKRHVTQSQINQIKALHKKGECTYKIAYKVGVSIPTARKYIKQGGYNKNAQNTGKNG